MLTGFLVDESQPFITLGTFGRGEVTMNVLDAISMIDDAAITPRACVQGQYKLGLLQGAFYIITRSLVDDSRVSIRLVGTHLAVLSSALIGDNHSVGIETCSL